MALGMRLFTDRVGNRLNGHPVLDAGGGEELMHVEPSVIISLGNRVVEATGTLYVTTKQVVWLSDTDISMGYALDFLSISLHAVSTNPETFAFPCIYIQVGLRFRVFADGLFLKIWERNVWDLKIDNGADGDSMDSEDLECEDIEHTDVFFPTKFTEMRLGPSDPNQLDTLFNVFCECAELNPDPIEEQDEDNEWNFGDNQMDSLDDSEWISEDVAIPIGLSDEQWDLSHTLQELNMNDRRFEDAEESETMSEKS